MNALVSVVLPIYNVEKYLNRCISSVVAQTYSNLEIILVDDNSTDSSPAICDEWAKRDSRIVVIHKENAGAGMARNTGIEHAHGEYICFFDSDDFVESDAVESCVKAAQENNAELVVFGHDDMTPEMRVLATHIPNPPKKFFSGEEIKNRLLPMSIYADLKTGEEWGMPMSPWNKLYSMEVIRKSGWRFVSEREILSEDFYSLTQFYGYVKSVCVIDRALYHYTVNNASLSHAYNPNRFSIEKISAFYSAMIALAEKMGVSDEIEQAIKGTTFGLSVCAMKNIVASDLKFKQKYSELRKMIKNDFSQELIRTTDYSGSGLQKKLLYRATKYKLVLICFLFIYLKNKRDT